MMDANPLAGILAEQTITLSHTRRAYHAAVAIIREQQQQLARERDRRLALDEEYRQFRARLLMADTSRPHARESRPAA